MIEKLLCVAYGALLACKIAGIVTWSWWIITLPFWGLWALFGIVVVGVALTLFITAIWEALTWK